ncbi:MAG TPA: bestrophin family ion channel [Pirellulales bacterium]|nr:bestrophin family ion channel [Pirellulales bacterium]
MTSWPFLDTVAVLAIGKRLSLLLAAVAAYCLAAGLIVWWWEIRVPDWGSAASLINTVILGMLMSFRNRAAYDRWWEARGLWGKLTNDSRNLATKIAAFVPAEAVGRAQAGDLLVAFAEALKRQLRDGALRLQDLPGFEQDEATPPHVPLYLAGRLYGLLAEWRRTGQIDDAVLWIFDRHLRGLLDVCGACEKVRNTPLSGSYKTLLRTGLVLNIAAEPWLTMPEMGFWGVPVFVLVCFFLLGVELIDTVVEEPFGRERDDLDLDRYCRTIRDNVGAVLSASAVLTCNEQSATILIGDEKR